MDYPTDPHTVSPGSLNQTLVPVIRPVHRNICKPAPPTPETPRSPINPPATANCDWRLEPSQDDKPKGADEPELDHELWICGVNWPAGFDPQAQTDLCRPDTYHQRNGCFSYCEPRRLASPDFVNGIEAYLRHWDESSGGAPLVYCSPRMNSFDGMRALDSKHALSSSAAAARVTVLMAVAAVLVGFVVAV